MLYMVLSVVLSTTLYFYPIELIKSVLKMGQVGSTDSAQSRTPYQADNGLWSGMHENRHYVNKPIKDLNEPVIIIKQVCKKQLNCNRKTSPTDRWKEWWEFMFWSRKHPVLVGIIYVVKGEMVGFMFQSSRIAIWSQPTKT